MHDNASPCTTHEAKTVPLHPENLSVYRFGYHQISRSTDHYLIVSKSSGHRRNSSLCAEDERQRQMDT